MAASLLLAAACGDRSPAPSPAALAAARERLLSETFPRRGIESETVYEAFRRVPREAFLPPDLAARAWEDRAMRRPDGETVTAPYLSAVMLQALLPDRSSLVLECGTRSGWFTALLAVTAGRVVTVDPREATSIAARRTLRRLGIENVRYVVGDPAVPPEGEGPFDAVVVNGAVRHVPKALYRALKPGGRILAPVGEPGEMQALIRSLRGEEEPAETRALLSVRFGRLRRDP